MIGDPPVFPYLQSGCVSLNPSPRIMPVLVPMPEYDLQVTVVTVDKDGNVHIWTNQWKEPLNG